MSDSSNIAELGRSKHSSTPSEHLEHLLNLGWNANSPLIKKYVQNNGLKRQLDELKQKLKDRGEKRE
jgi:hypothetical protein